MVKIFSIFLLLSTLVFAQNIFVENLNEVKSPIVSKVKTFLSEESFNKNKEYIKIIFSPESDYYVKNRVDVVKIAKTLKENGLLNLFFDKPQELRLSFKTSGYPLFFVKIMGDTLRNIGYYRYVTTESNLDISEFRWDISLNSEYATDPHILQQELEKSGCLITDIKRVSKNYWSYSIDINNGFLNVKALEDSVEMSLKRSLYAHWLNVSNVKNINIKSSLKNKWYPHIVFYDKELHILKVIKEDTKTSSFYVEVPKSAKYIKITDMYTLKNIKDDLVLNPSGSR